MKTKYFGPNIWDCLLRSGGCVVYSLVNRLIELDDKAMAETAYKRALDHPLVSPWNRGVVTATIPKLAHDITEGEYKGILFCPNLEMLSLHIDKLHDKKSLDAVKWCQENGCYNQRRDQLQTPVIWILYPRSGDKGHLVVLAKDEMVIDNGKRVHVKKILRRYVLSGVLTLEQNYKKEEK